MCQQQKRRAAARRTEFFSGKMPKWLIKGLTNRLHPWRFSGIREKLGGELDSPVVERLNKGLLTVS
eukprot:674866-Prorocentrum_minimum.AAC.1